MTTILLFPSVLGVRPGIGAAADLLRDAGHEVHVVDLYDGQVFDDYDEGLARSEQLGFAPMLRTAVAAGRAVEGPLVTLGFSMGVVPAEYVAATRPDVLGVVTFGGGVPPSGLNLTWPPGLSGQMHTTLDDPWREQEEMDGFAAEVAAAGGTIEVFDYPGGGHLFTDPSLAEEHQPAEADLAWSRVLDFLRRGDPT